MSRAAVASNEARRTLILNTDYTPLSTWPLSTTSIHKAVHMLYRERADVVEEWGGVFRSCARSYPVPKVVALRYYAPIYGRPKFCRRSILLRDRYRCQYCGDRFDAHELTFDHVVPRSKGGKTVWENILAACLKCNGQKAGQDANHSGRRGVVGRDGKLRPLKEPRRPTAAGLLRAGLEFLPNDIREDFGSYLYWNVELQA